MFLNNILPVNFIKTMEETVIFTQFLKVILTNTSKIIASPLSDKP